MKRLIDYLKTMRIDWKSMIWSALGVGIALLLWQVFTSRRFMSQQFSEGFCPRNTLHELRGFIQGGAMKEHALPSLKRVGVGLGVASVIGIPVGLLIGYFAKLNSLTTVVFQFLRMTSPLAWMPLAIIVFGVGDKPVYFLIAMACVWPIIISTAHGVRSVNPNWIRVVRMLGAYHWGVLWRAIIPAVIPDILTGLRISLGIAWVILVPAEMLGVPSGLGYYILDTRDRFNFGELMAVILVVGFFGFISDGLLRILQQCFSWRGASEESLVR